MNNEVNIALVGRLGSGKSTVARILGDNGWVKHSWADSVRDVFSMAYEVITPENYEFVKSASYTTVENGVKAWRTGRELLQRIGTDAMRNVVDEDFWLKAGLRRLGDDPTVNDDTRFLNEAEALRERGFKLVRIVRPGHGSDSSHPSEVEQDLITVDYTLTNDGTIDDLALKVSNLVHFESILRYRVLSIASRDRVPLPTPLVTHEVVSEDWGDGDGPIIDFDDDIFSYEPIALSAAEAELDAEFQFRGYGRTGDPSTRSAHENEVTHFTFGFGGEPCSECPDLPDDTTAAILVEYRGEWPPDTRVDGRLTCCGASSHTLDCPQWR